MLPPRFGYSVQQEDKESRDYRRWLVKSGYHDVLPILASSISTFDSRLDLLEKDLATARKLLKDFHIEKAVALSDLNRSSSIGKDIKLHKLARELYYSVIECITRLQVLVEITLLYYGSLRIGAKHLPQLLTETWGVNLKDETSRIGKLRIRDVMTDFQFPDVSNYVCSKSQKSLLRSILRRTAITLRQFLQEIVEFRMRFSIVSNKYKHALVEIMDRYAVIGQTVRIECVPQFYVRSKERKPPAGHAKVCTYIVRVDEPFLDYLDALIGKWATVTVTLIDNYLQWLVNQGKPAFPRHIDIKPEERQQAKEAIDKEPSFRHVTNFEGIFHIIWKPKAVAKIEKGLQKRHIARLDFDLMDPRKLKKMSLTRKPSHLKNGT